MRSLEIQTLTTAGSRTDQLARHLFSSDEHWKALGTPRFAAKLPRPSPLTNGRFTFKAFDESNGTVYLITSARLRSILSKPEVDFRNFFRLVGCLGRFKGILVVNGHCGIKSISEIANLQIPLRVGGMTLDGFNSANVLLSSQQFSLNAVLRLHNELTHPGGTLGALTEDLLDVGVVYPTSPNDLSWLQQHFSAIATSTPTQSERQLGIADLDDSQSAYSTDNAVFLAVDTSWDEPSIDLLWNLTTRAANVDSLHPSMKQTGFATLGNTDYDARNILQSQVGVLNFFDMSTARDAILFSSGLDVNELWNRPEPVDRIGTINTLPIPVGCAIGLNMPSIWGAVNDNGRHMLQTGPTKDLIKTLGAPSTHEEYQLALQAAKDFEPPGIDAPTLPPLIIGNPPRPVPMDPRLVSSKESCDASYWNYFSYLFNMGDCATQKAQEVKKLVDEERRIIWEENCKEKYYQDFPECKPPKED